jgi:hypothetical protein
MLVMLEVGVGFAHRPHVQFALDACLFLLLGPRGGTNPRPGRAVSGKLGRV